jgi:hypothetical protein
MADLKVLTALSASSGVAVSGSAGLIVNQGGLTVNAGTVTLPANSLTASSINNFTTDVRGQFSNGTGVTITNGQVSIGQAVGTGDSVQFENVKINGNITTDDNENKTLWTSVGNGSTITVGGAGSTVEIAGNLTVKGTTTTVDSNTVNVGDANLNLGTGSADLGTLSGGGIDLGSGSVVQWRYDNTSGGWRSNKNVDLASGQIYKINNTEVLSATALGSGITASSLTSVGTITSLTASVLNVTGEVKLDGSSITLGNGSGDVVTATGQLTASQGIDLGSGKAVKIGGVDALKVLETSYSINTPQGLTPLDFTGSVLVSGSSDSLVGILENTSPGIAFTLISGSGGVVIEGGNQFGVELRSANNGITLNAVGGVSVTTGSGDFSALPVGSIEGSIDLTGSLDYILQNLGGGGGNSVTSTQYYGARVAATGSKASSADIEFKLLTAGTFDDVGAPGTNVYNIPKVNGLSSSTAGDTGFQELMNRMSYASIDVAVKESGSLTSWTNDLVSVTVSGTYDAGAGGWLPLVKISAPALAADASTKVRLIVVNEVSGALAL